MTAPNAPFPVRIPISYASNVTGDTIHPLGLTSGYKLRPIRAVFTPNESIAIDGTNYRSLAFDFVDEAGANATELAPDLTTFTGGTATTAGTAIVLSLTAASVDGDWQVKITGGGGGTEPAISGDLVLWFEPIR